MKYIDPLTDFGFKKLFGTEPNKALLIDFLNELLPLKHQINDLEYSNNEQLQPTQKERSATFDIHCKSVVGEYFIVELQRIKQQHFKERSVYYSCFAVQKQAKPKVWNFDLKAVYTICILDFKFEDHKDEAPFLHEVKLKNQVGNVFYDKLTCIYIELPKFEKAIDNLATKFEKWLYVFRHLANLQEQPIELQEQIFRDLFKAAKIANFTPMELSQYEASLKVLRDNHNTMDYAKKQAKIEGRAEGRIEGKIEGKIEGRIEGKIEGRIEGKIEMIKSIYANNISITIEQLAEVSGLSKEEVEDILKEE